MNLLKKFSVHLLCLSILSTPVMAQAQEQLSPQATTQPGAAKAFVSEAVPSAVATTPFNTAPAFELAIPDTVYPGQKKPFRESQLLEGDDKRFLKRVLLPAGLLIGAGVYTIQDNGLYSSFDARDARHRHFPNFRTQADDFLMFAPLVGMYGFNLISSQNRHELPRQTALLLASGALTSAIVWPSKKITNIDRPSGEPWAFFSGHTAYAFTIATFMDKEFRHKSPWVSVASYSIAGATGLLRVMNNDHWMADVLAGAGVGILSTNMIYWLHAKMVDKKALKDAGLNTAVAPVMLPTGQPGIGMQIKF